MSAESTTAPTAASLAGAPPALSALRRPSGAFAMLALDQREAMREMFARHQDSPVTDEQLTRFKLTAARVLTPYASGVLLDRQFVFDRAVAEAAVTPGCGLIAAADHFVPAHGELVGEVTIDRQVDPETVRRQGAVAMKLLVIYRPDGDARSRIEMVEEFVDRCRRAGLVSIIEPVSRRPLDASERNRDADARGWDWDAGVLAAARELGSRGADLYKAEVPLHGRGDPDEIRRRCAQITEAVSSPWVVLSSGVDQDVFPSAVALACREGASGFLAGRAVWASCIGAADVPAELAGPAVDRLTRLCAVVDEVVGARNGGQTATPDEGE